MMVRDGFGAHDGVALSENGRPQYLIVGGGSPRETKDVVLPQTMQI